MTTRLDGADGSAVLGGTTYYWRGSSAMNLNARKFKGRATGDNAAEWKSGSGLEDGSNVTLTGVMQTVVGALALLDGTEISATILQGATTAFACTRCMVTVTLDDPAEDMSTATVVLAPQIMPTTPALTFGMS